MAVPPTNWRNERQIRGIQSHLQGAINASDNGATGEVDLATLRAAVEICEQAQHTEQGHEVS